MAEYIRRALEPTIRRYSQYFKVVLVTEPRQVGKTTMLKHLMEEDEAYERICAGSLPGIRALPDDLRAAGYESYLDTYIMRDIHDICQVGDELKFRHFMRACVALTSKPVVYSDLARTVGISEKPPEPGFRSWKAATS